MKRIVCILFVLCFSVMIIFTGCKKEEKLICGVTEYEPMNYRVDGKWTGFDTEFALKTGEKLGLKVEFQMIVWGQKFSELESGAIDAIWNGFTANSSENGVPRSNLCDMSYSYMINKQSVVIRANRSNEFTSADSLSGKKIAVEAGSAGESEAKEYIGSGQIIGATAQIDTFLEVKSGAADAAVVDIILARQITSSGDFSDLKIADIDLGEELYAIGFKKGNPLRNRVNQAMQELYNDGTLAVLAKKYGLENRLQLNTNFGR